MMLEKKNDCVIVLKRVSKTNLLLFLPIVQMVVQASLPLTKEALTLT
jgi:hypothetical protein